MKLEGDRELGRLIFEERCVSCHQHDNPERGVGPELTEATAADKARLLQSILDPSREIPPAYWNYSATTSDGQAFEGILTGETAAQITLRLIDGREQVLDRSDIETFRRQNQSLMPEGLEAGLTPHDLANLLAYITHLAKRPRR